MVKNHEISIIICTHNRADMLEWCLPSYAVLEPGPPLELLVVLNACTDRSLEVVQAYMEQLPFLRYCTEEALGLSAARNRGAVVAKGSWLVYIDDDARPAPDLLKHIAEVLQAGVYSAFSGHSRYTPEGSPPWIQGSDIEAPYHAHQLSALPEHAFMNGCICGFKKETLLELGGFDSAFGMKGRHTAYGEEVDIQYRLWNAGHGIAYHPFLLVEHRSHFKRLKELLVAEFQKGRYMQYLSPQGRFRHALKAVYIGFFGILSLPASIVRSRYWQRAALDAFGAPMYHLGRALSFKNRLALKQGIR